MSFQSFIKVGSGIRIKIEMNDTIKHQSLAFRTSVTQSLLPHGLDLSTVADESDAVEKRCFEEYGAIFLTTATPPSKVMFTSDAEVLEFQNSTDIAGSEMDGIFIELQAEAMTSLISARSDAGKKGLNITPRGGVEAARRSFGKTVDLWASRFEPAIDHWIAKGRLDIDQATRLRSFPIKRQVAEVLELEKEEIYFNTFFNNSILYSVAAPGTSQHLSMLAFDVAEFADLGVQEVMAENGWFRTVQNDAPHFTYLGHKESELPVLGLEKVQKNDGSFWIPDLGAE